MTGSQVHTDALLRLIAAYYSADGARRKSTQPIHPMFAIELEDTSKRKGLGSRTPASAVCVLAVLVSSLYLSAQPKEGAG